MRFTALQTVQSLNIHEISSVEIFICINSHACALEGTREQFVNVAMEVPSQQHSSDHQSFRHNFQAWVDSNYGEHSRTKTITRAKYTKICRYLMGEEVETDAKFRFWVKSKAFRILRHQLDPNIGVLCVPVSVSGVKGQVG